MKDRNLLSGMWGNRAAQAEEAPVGVEVSTTVHTENEFLSGQIPDNVTLLQHAVQIMTLSGTTDENDWEDHPDEEVLPCYDGYMRHSPVQHYRTPKGYRMRCIRKILLCVGIVVFAALAILAIIRSGLIPLHF